MILVGQYDSPYVRRVAVSPRVLGFDYRHDTRSVFVDFDAMRRLNQALAHGDGRACTNQAESYLYRPCGAGALVDAALGL